MSENQTKNTVHFEKSKWVKRMVEILKDPQTLEKFENAVSDWLQRKGKTNPAAKRADQAYQIFRDGKAKELLTPRNVLLLGAALLYLISPLDAIPDIAPIIGLLDDLGILTLILSLVIPDYLENEVPEEQREQLRREAKIIQDELQEAETVDVDIVDEATVPPPANSDDEASENKAFSSIVRRMGAYFRSKQKPN